MLAAQLVSSADQLFKLSQCQARPEAPSVAIQSLTGVSCETSAAQRSISAPVIHLQPHTTDSSAHPPAPRVSCSQHFHGSLGSSAGPCRTLGSALASVAADPSSDDWQNQQLSEPGFSVLPELEDLGTVLDRQKYRPSGFMVTDFTASQWCQQQFAFKLSARLPEVRNSSNAMLPFHLIIVFQHQDWPAPFSAVFQYSPAGVCSSHAML